MQHSFTIEVLSPGGIQWQFYESLEDTLAGLLTHVYCVRKAFPSCAVRAVDMATGQVVNLIRGTYADEQGSVIANQQACCAPLGS